MRGNSGKNQARIGASHWNAKVEVRMRSYATRNAKVATNLLVALSLWVKFAATEMDVGERSFRLLDLSFFTENLVQF